MADSNNLNNRIAQLLGAGSNGIVSNGIGSIGTGSNGTGSNGTYSNGAGSNGTYSNGAGSNGTDSNGTYSNGAYSNGAYSNGTGSNGIVSNGMSSNGTGSDGTYSNDTYSNGAGSNGATGSAIPTAPRGPNGSNFGNGNSGLSHVPQSVAPTTPPAFDPQNYGSTLGSWLPPHQSPPPFSPQSDGSTLGSWNYRPSSSPPSSISTGLPLHQFPQFLVVECQRRAAFQDMVADLSGCTLYEIVPSCDPLPPLPATNSNSGYLMKDFHALTANGYRCCKCVFLVPLRMCEARYLGVVSPCYQNRNEAYGKVMELYTLRRNYLRCQGETVTPLEEMSILGRDCFWTCTSGTRDGVGHIFWIIFKISDFPVCYSNHH